VKLEKKITALLYLLFGEETEFLERPTAAVNPKLLLNNIHKRGNMAQTTVNHDCILQ